MILTGSILSAMRPRKIIAFLILIFFAVPIATVFCCCTDFDPKQPRQEVLGHHHESHDHGSQHQGSGQGDKSSSESCECGNKVIAHLVNRTTIDFSVSNTHFSKLQNDPAFQLHISSAFQAAPNAIYFHDTGPPGSNSSTPLYLQISVLRI